ncbi:MAG: helix-turn-helix transcriptional regulator [Candidatus Hydrogenedentes bacterium]|nr:helix-turn-helix transcriptional regulator [Candidatus Hydrogenedentota bacterium]
MKARRDIFQAIADPTRRSMLQLLLEEPSTVGVLAEQFSVSRQAISLHVRVLEECGAIAVENQGRERVCRLEPATLAKVSAWLDPFVVLWDQRFDQLEDFLNKQEEESDESVSEQDGIHEGS